MSIHLISAVPGAGKTLRAVMMACKQMTEEPDRPLFSNINGFARAAPIPDEWMDCPDGSLIVLDECQQRWRRYRQTGAPPPEIAALETHRHRGVDFILTCQNPLQLSGDVRALVDVHEHLMRRGKLGGAIVWRWEGHCHTNPASHAKDADCEVTPWKHPKEYFCEYQSATIHTGKRRLPRILLIAPVVFLGAAASVFYAVHTLANLGESDDSEAVASAPASSPSVASAPDPVQPTATAAGGMQHGDRCQLYDADGRTLLVSMPTCLEAFDRGLPREVDILEF